MAMMKTPKIVTMPDIAWPPGTILRLKHRPDLFFEVMEITSWHDYNTFKWDREGVHISTSYHYHIRGMDGKTSASFCGEQDEYEVVMIPGDKSFRRCITCQGVGHYIHNRGGDRPCTFCNGAGWKKDDSVS
jgi:hypothetical protein